MKKSFLLLLLMGNLLNGYGQQHVQFQTACHPEDVKHYDTKTLR
jgi:4-deoxy-L-threo-5-hexosulose-uronate ketol-isomerase